MRAWQFDEKGSLHNMHLREVPDPQPESGDAVIRIDHAGINPADHFLIKGQYPRSAEPPFTVGREAVGIVEVPGPSNRFQVGDRVLVLGGETGIRRMGTLAERCALPEAWLAPAPPHWSAPECAGAVLTHLTAWLALVVHGGLQAGEIVLVTGASGGVGTAAVSLAKGLGATVLACSRSEAKRARLAEMGADAVFDANDPKLPKTIKGYLDGRSVALAVDNLGGPWMGTCVALLGFGGRVLSVGLLSGFTAEVSVGLLIHKQIRIQGLTVSSYTPKQAQDAWARVVETLDVRQARPIVDCVCPMERTVAAFEHLESSPFGKVVIQVAE